MLRLKDAIASDEDLELDSPFMDAGMDSLSSVALMSMVAKEGLHMAKRLCSILKPIFALQVCFDVIFHDFPVRKLPMTTIVTCRSSKWP